ncbi:DUF2956 domain-containing protein [Thalassotalea atypica]|uniref:DUF2956 domain-containing protein n=1 Tax=Thalassotalea atypica TaxID=2054316 RepID=UPI0025748924|nr:DUF2956 domain-containing protein [Thalassotalea atypica]
MKNKVSPEVQEQALKVAKGIQKPGQTKEQTKLIAQGIEKGIAEYKKQQNKKLREKDKQRKQKIKQQAQQTEGDSQQAEKAQSVSKMPWLLLTISWLGFIAYVTLT